MAGPIDETVELPDGLPVDQRFRSLGDLNSKLVEQISRSAYALLGMMMAAATLHLLANALQTDQSWSERWVNMRTAGSIWALSLVAFGLARLFGIRTAAAFFSWSTMLVLFGSATLSGLGLQAPGLVGVMALLVVMGLLVGTGSAKLATALAVLGYLALWQLEAQGWITGAAAEPSGMMPSSASHAVVYIATSIILGWLVARYSALFWDVTSSLEGSRRLLAETVRAQQLAAQDLRDSEERLRILLDSSLTCIQILEGDSGALRFANAQTLRAYGCARVLELDFSLICPGEPYSKDRLMQRVRRAVDEGAQYFEWQSKRLDGAPVWWDIKMERLLLGEESCVVVFGHDITARVRAEAELRISRTRLEDEVRERTTELVTEKLLIQSILEALPITLSIRDLQGRYTLVNRSFERATGMQRQAVLGNTARDIFPAAIAAEIADTDARLMAGAGSLTVERQMGEAKVGGNDYLITTVPLLDAQERPIAVLNLGTEISSLKRLQRELSLAKDEAERLALAKSDFLANMSHEIRTPLNAVLGLAQLGIGRSADPVAARSGFERIVRSGRHLLGVINDILDYSKVESGKLDIENLPCNLSHLVKEVLELVSERADAKNLRLRVEYKATQDWVMLDTLRATQILVNLLSNAIKFTDKGRVVLSVEQGEGRLLFAVTDTGVGLSPEQQSRVFTAFEQADSSTTRKFGGTGLGLSISSQLATAMGGSITVSSELGVGSCFTLDLPCIHAKPEPAAAAPEPTTTPESGPGPADPGASISFSASADSRAEIDAGKAMPLRGLRLLITDDVDINREILQDMLSALGADVVSADGGAQALLHLREVGPGGFDLVLMDVQMPDMDGYEATRLIHQLAPKLKVLALTAHALPEERRRCLAAGMVAHVTKPIDQAELLRVLLAQSEGLPRRAADDAQVHSPITAPITPPISAPIAAPPPANSRATPWPQLAGTDFAAALTRCAGRQELLAKLLGTFAKQYAQHQTLFEEAQATGLPALCSAAHRLKGLAGNLGLISLAERATALETASGAQGDTDQIPAALRDMNAELVAIVVVIAAWHRRYTQASD
ncbi:response regulator [Paucibacter sp. TC2R-5]|uniref:ATP-binding protein n=1 Tax=Paucibacter sp. TC2R-5 TaxID=2893555 RepID=UPI0021E3B884|nr:ATP-binding protein [Paucibacter sp. TC2R-5]MCV2360782.1 response regulator [Paucibacter sp. TC2R-5]